MERVIVVHEISTSEFLDQIEARVKNLLNNQPVRSIENDKLLTREEASKFLNITLATLNTYTKQGKIKSYRIGSRVIYKTEDLLEALEEVKHGKYKKLKL